MTDTDAIAAPDDGMRAALEAALPSLAPTSLLGCAWHDAGVVLSVCASPVAAAAAVKGLADSVWFRPGVAPEIPRGTERSFIVAVRRARNGKTYSFPAIYLNAYPLLYESGDCPKGNGCAGDGCDDGCPTTGWYSESSDGDYDSNYTRLHLDAGDEFLAWSAIPQFDPDNSVLSQPTDAGWRTAVDEIAAERRRQVEVEGWTPEHDDGHRRGELAFAGASYAVISSGQISDVIVARQLWPWDRNYWKPTDRRRDLVKAGALIIAEIERLDRATRPAPLGGKDV